MKMKKGTFLIKDTTILIGIVAILALVAFGYISLPQSIGSSNIEVSGSGICPSTGNTNLLTGVKESIAASNGVKSQILGNMAYAYSGSIDPFETTALSSTALASSTTDPKCGASIYGIFTNASYYSFKTPVIKVPDASDTQITGEADLIGSFSLAGSNQTIGTKTSTPLYETMAASQTDTMTIYVKENTARGVLRNVALCFNYTVSNNTEVSIIGGTKLTDSIKKVTNQECWATGQTIKDYQEIAIPIKVVTSSTFHAGGTIPTYVTVTAMDLGTYTKATGDVLFNGYENPDTHVDVGATDGTFVIAIY